jgi:NADH:ubiquinone oxidoreductase subunit 2 (subunit N)
LAGVVISLYYYFGVVRAIYWSRDVAVTSPINLAWPIRIAIMVCVAGIFYLGIFPGD